MDIFAPEFHYFWLLAVGLLGLCLGSFAGALAYRMPKNIAITGRTRSACPNCGTTLRASDLYPVISWLKNRGRCRYCGDKISPDYLIIEIVTTSLALGFFLIYGYSAATPFLILLSPVITALFFIDLRHMILPDKLNLAIIVLGLGAITAEGILAPWHIMKSLWMQSVMGAIIYFVMAYILTWGVSLALKKQAMGGGDIKFFAAAGIWLGPVVLPMFMMVAGACGVIFGLISRRLTGRAYFPFGPALIVSFIVALLMQKTVFLTIL